MKWNHIMQKQPKEESTIIQLDAPYIDKITFKDGWEKHYLMGMRYYCSYGQPWHEFLEVSRKSGWKDPDFYWVYAKDFPFPKEDKKE